MKYMLLAYEAAEDFAARGAPDAARRSGYWARWKAFGEALNKAGVVGEMHGLGEGGAAATLTLSNGERAIRKGAYADSPTQLGGYFILDVPSLEDALDWAAQCPSAATGAVEVRPLLVRP